MKKYPKGRKIMKYVLLFLCIFFTTTVRANFATGYIIGSGGGKNAGREEEKDKRDKIDLAVVKMLCENMKSECIRAISPQAGKKRFISDSED